MHIIGGRLGEIGLIMFESLLNSWGRKGGEEAARLVMESSWAVAVTTLQLLREAESRGNPESCPALLTDYYNYW